MKSVARVFMVIFSMLAVHQANADGGGYIGVGVSKSKTAFVSSADVSASKNGNDLFLGYRLNDSPVSLELGLVNFGEKSFPVDGTLDDKGRQFTAAWNFFDASGTGNLYVKAGVYSIKTTVIYAPSGGIIYERCPSGNCSLVSSGLVTGVGGELNISKNFSFYAELDVYRNVNLIIGTASEALAAVGARVKF